MEQKHDILLMMKIITDRASTIFASKVKLPLTSAQSRVLSYLAAKGDAPVAQKDVEQHLGVTHSTAKGLLQRLEEKGFVRTAFDSKDKRVKHVYRTEKSCEVKETVYRYLEDLENLLFRGLSEEELAQLAAMLYRVRDNVLQ